MKISPVTMFNLTVGLGVVVHSLNEIFFNDGVLFAGRQSRDYPGAVPILVLGVILVIWTVFSKSDSE